jgi:short-subunit dehydrogenase
MAKRTFKLALLTGGSSGIGLALAVELVKAGTSVILVARRPDVLAGAKAELDSIAAGGAQVRTLSLDTSDAEAVRRDIPAILAETGAPDLLYNGAGITGPDHFTNITYETFQGIIDINVGGVWHMLSAVIPLMKASGGGTVVNVSSVAGLVGFYGYSAYAASKFAVVGLSQSLRNELKPDGIDVRVLCPPDTDTPQLAQEDLTKPDESRKISGKAPVMKPRTVARVLLKGLGRRSFLILPGFMSKVTWLLYRLFPSLVHLVIDNDVRTVRKRKSSA